MAISFQDSLKAAQEESKSAVKSTAFAAEPEIMTLESYGIATADDTVAAYSGDDGSWIQVTGQGYDFYDEYNDENVSTIDDEKFIKLNPKQFNITQETNSQYIPFEMPRYYDGFDLTKAKLQIHFVNSRGHGGIDYPANVYYNNDKIRFAWLVDSRATQVEGALNFEIQAIGKNSKNEDYVWKSRTTKDLNVLESLTSTAYIEPDSSWQDSFMARIEGQVVIAQNQAALAQAAAQEATAQAQKAADSAQEAKDEVAALKDGITDEVETVVDATVGDVVDEKIADVLLDYYNQEETDAKIQEVVDAIPEVDLTGYATEEYVGAALGGYYTKTEVDTAIDNVDVSGQLGELGESEDGTPLTVVEYVDKKVADVDVSDQLVNYYTKTESDVKTDALAADIATNETSISSLNNSVIEINEVLDGIDKSPNAYYVTTYNEPYTLEGTEYTGENALVLYEIYNKDTENETRSVVSAHIITGGSGGSISSNTIKIDRITISPVYATADENVVIKYTFTGTDASGDDIGIGKATWKVGTRTVKTESIYTGDNSVDLTEFLSVGSDQKVTLIVTDDIGTMQQKIWYVNVIDIRLTSTFDDARTYNAGENITFSYTPYGAVDKTVHFLLDGKEIDKVSSSKSAAGLSASYSIPAQEHGTHLFEVYITAEINGKTIESNHIVKDIIWYDENSDVPVIGTIKQAFTARQYEATNIIYTVYNPSTETPNVSLKATYVNEDGETVEEYSSNVVMSSNTATWQYKTDVIGEHILTITCGETVKTLIATIVELGIDVSPITAGLVFDFNPVGYSNDDENRLWSSGDIAMSVSNNFDWVNGGYQIDDYGDQCFCIKAGTSAEINYELFGDDAKANGKQFKLIFKTENVASSDATFLSCVSDPTGTGKIGIEMKSQEATIYAKTESLPLPYAEEEVIEFEFNISASSEVPSMVMGYEDGVSTRPLVYDVTHDFQQQIGYRETISLGSPDCDFYIYRFKVYSTSLSDRDILNNFIADARSAEEMIDRYDRNQIYKEGILDPDYLAEVCPDLRIIKLEVPHFTRDKDDKVYNPNIQTIIECIYKNGDPIYDNWVAYDCVHSGQGTSSNNYGASGRNLDLIMKSYKDYGNEPYIVLGDGSQVSKVSLTRESIPVNYFNLKVNIASSENANNALLQKRYNQYNPYKRPFVREDESIIPYIKSTMEFQNCAVFIKESDPDLSTHVEFADNQYHFYALGNIGDSKKTDSTRLTDPDDPYECILEVMDNTLPLSNMPTGKVDENGAPVYPVNASEWVAGNTAYDALYGETFDEAEASKKENGLDDTYGWRYIYEDGTDEENAEAKAFVENKWREFYEFVIMSTDEEFKANLGDWCVLDSIMYYYLFTLRYTMTDNHAKNSFWHYGKSNDLNEDGVPIRKWDLCFDYDND